MTSQRLCWNKYAKHVGDWYAQTYKSKEAAYYDAQKINGALTYYGDQMSETNTWSASVWAKMVADKAKEYGASRFAAETAQIYIQNTARSFMDYCTEEKGGFSEDVACMSDADCPQGYRCRGVGVDSTCIPSPVYEPDPGYTLPSLPSMPSMPSMPGTDIKRSLQVTGLVLIGVILLIFYMLTGRGKKGVTVVK